MKKSRTPRHRRGIIRSLLNLLTPQGRQAVLSSIIYISIPVIGISTLSNPANLWAVDYGKYVGAFDLTTFTPSVDEKVADYTEKINGNETNIYFKDSNQFSSIQLLGGTLHSFGPTIVEGNTEVASILPGDTWLISEGGKQEFSNITLSGGYISISGISQLNNGTNIQNYYSLSDDKYIESEGIKINGNIYVAGLIDQQTYETILSGMLGLFGNTEYTGSTIECKIGGALFGNANSYNTDITLDDKSATLYLSDAFKIVENPDKTNTWYITKDKNGNITPLEWEAARNNINDAIQTNQIHDKKLSGNGNLFINSYHPTTEEGSASYNGYTVVFQDIKNNGNFTEWEGYTYIKAGTLVLRQGVVYGNEETFGLEVYGEEYTSIGTNESGIEVYNVDSCGMLAFYTNGAETAPTVNGDKFVLRDGKDGARLWFDTNTKAENGNMGTINANKAIIGSKTQVWYDGISKIDSDTTRSITLNAMHYFKGELNEKEQYIDNAKEAKEYIENIFGQAALVDATYNLANRSISITPRDVADFAAEQNMTRDEQDYAAVIDENRLEAEDGYSNFYDALYNENSDSKVRQTIHNLANGSGIENVMMLTSHMGNPGSVFFGGMTTMGGASTRGQEEQPESSNPVSAAPQSYQQQDPNRWTAWANYSHSAINGSAYVKDGIRKDGYDVRRTGILTGLKNNLSDTFSMGVLFAYSSPELSQNGFYESDSGNDRYFTNIEMNDFQLALQFNKLLPRNWHLSAFVGGGAQSLDWKRNVIVDNTGYQFTGDTDGNTLTATFYLSKHLQMTETFALMPTIGFDTEHSWMDGFSEKGNDMNDPAHILSATASKYNYDNIAYDRQTFRVGLIASAQSPTNIFGASARVFYGRQLNDEEAATVHIWNDTFKKGFDVEGNAMGKDSWNFGFNGYMYLNTAKTLTLTADYNTILYRNASMQNVTAGLQWRF